LPQGANSRTRIFSHPSNLSILHEVHMAPWYWSILVLWYAMACIIAAFSLYTIPTNGNALLTSEFSEATEHSAVNFSVQFYAIVIPANFILLWLYILLVLPKWKFLSSSKIASGIFGLFWFFISACATFWLWVLWIGTEAVLNK